MGEPKPPAKSCEVVYITLLLGYELSHNLLGYMNFSTITMEFNNLSLLRPALDLHLSQHQFGEKFSKGKRLYSTGKHTFQDIFVTLVQ